MVIQRQEGWHFSGEIKGLLKKNVSETINELSNLQAIYFQRAADQFWKSMICTCKVENYLYYTLADKDQIRYKNLRIPIHRPPLWQFNQVGCLTGGIYLSYQRVRVRRSEPNWTASLPQVSWNESLHTRWTTTKKVGGCPFCKGNQTN